MRVQLKSFLLVMVSALLLAGAGMVHAASTTITASATVQTATITLTPVTNLNFGTIVSAGASNILIDASGGAANSSVNSGTASITIAGTSGLIDVDSPVSATVNITYSVADTAGPVADQLDDGSGNTMAFTGASIHTYSTGGGTNPGTLALVAGVTSQIHVGGLLQIGAAQTAGTYTGTITVGVNY